MPLDVEQVVTAIEADAVRLARELAPLPEGGVAPPFRGAITGSASAPSGTWRAARRGFREISWFRYLLVGTTDFIAGHLRKRIAVSEK